MSDPNRPLPGRSLLLIAALALLSGLSACDRRPSDPNRPTVASDKAPPAATSSSAPDTQR